MLSPGAPATHSAPPRSRWSPRQRKNGLFKKAYELGVLCSVDVAVIIFEERPGHELKLHQYSSGDIRDIVQRQIRHQGEKDVKRPGDFSGAAGSKFDADGEGDDDDEEDVPVRTTRSKANGKSTSSSSAPVAASSEPEPTAPSRSSLQPGNQTQTQVPPPPPLLRLDDSSSPGGGGLNSLLPVSNDRLSNVRQSNARGSLPNKRPRLMGEYSSRSRTPSEDEALSVSKFKTTNGDLYLERGRFDDGHHHQHHHHQQRQRNGFGGAGLGTGSLTGLHAYSQADSLFPSSQGYGTTGYGDPFSPVGQGPSSSFMSPMNGHHHQHHHAGMSRGDFATDSYDHGSRNRYPGSTYDSPMYTSLLRPPSAGPPGSQYPTRGFGLGIGGGGREDRGDAFSALLEADERSRQQVQDSQAGNGGGDLMWPIHESRGPGSVGSGDGIGSIPPRTDSDTDPGTSGNGNGGGSSGGNWLDFLSSGKGVQRESTGDIASIFGLSEDRGKEKRAAKAD